MELQKTMILGYAHFQRVFLRVLDKHAPMKKKILRANDKPFMNKVLRGAIMRRSFLKNRYYKLRTEESHNAFKEAANTTGECLPRLAFKLRSY